MQGGFTLDKSVLLGVHEDTLYGWAFSQYRVDHDMESLDDNDMIAQIRAYTHHIAQLLYDRYDLCVTEGGDPIDLG